MKKIKILLIIVISFFISVTNCFAQEIDVNKICSITGKYNYSDVSISDTKIYLYRIADISNIAKYTYVSDFSSFDIDIVNCWFIVSIQACTSSIIILPI